jgi:hypothetical protein
MNPFQKLDLVLKVMSSKENLYFNKPLFDWAGETDIEPMELEQILIKLADDGYVSIHNEPYGNVTGRSYRITFLGNHFYYSDGYEGLDLLRKIDQKKLELAEKTSMRNEKFLLWLTAVLTLGTLCQATLALADLYWKYKWFHF